jgi:hypothetical protein
MSIRSSYRISVGEQPRRIDHTLVLIDLFKRDAREEMPDEPLSVSSHLFNHFSSRVSIHILLQKFEILLMSNEGYFSLKPDLTALISHDTGDGCF